MGIDLSKFKAIFISEFEDHLQKLDDNLLRLEKSPNDKALLDELMRSAHTIKGSAATMGYTQTAFLTHVLEDVFDYARNDLVKIDRGVMNELFAAVDALGKSLRKIESSDCEDDLKEISQSIKAITGVKTEGIGKSVRAEDGKPVTVARAEVKPVLTLASAVEVSKIETISNIKVPVKRLDDLMNLMEELLIDKMKLENLKITDSEFKSVTNHLSRLISDIQYQVMQTRLVALDQVFLRFPRMVRDLAEKTGKEIDFDIVGGSLELDRTIVDKLGEPLIHLLRNAVDHGISQKGSVKMEAAREREFALVSVEDDGAGIDWKKVVETALERGLLKASEGEKYLGLVKDFYSKLQSRLENREIESIERENALMAHEVVDLLLHGRLSTNEKVTETSGRGVGLNIAKIFAEQMSGRLIVESPSASKIVDGKLVTFGARFSLELPLSLAIIKALLVRIKDRVFAIPFSGIERSVALSLGDIKSMADQDIAIVDGVDIPLVNLEKIFSLVTPDTVQPPKKHGGSELAVIIKRGRETAGIRVDELIKEQELIIKPMPTVLRHANGFSGSTTLGNGETILVLDVSTLLSDTRKLTRK
ncbi:MAG: chemotaxis protein CheW [bacterium]